MNIQETSIFPSLMGLILVLALIVFLSMFNYTVGAWCINTSNAAIALLRYFIF